MKRPALLALALAAVLVQASEPPVRNYSIHVPDRTLATRPVFDAKFGSFVVELEKTTLQQVITAASAGIIEHTGDAGGSTYWVCYLVGENSTQSTVWLFSGEMGGSNHAVLEVMVTNTGTDETTRNCPTLPPHMRKVSLAGGLAIGMPSEELAVQLGVEVGTLQQWHGYTYSLKIPSEHCGGAVDGGGAVAAQVQNGKVVALATHQVTSC